MTNTTTTPLWIRAVAAALDNECAKLEEAARCNPNLASHYRAVARAMMKDAHPDVVSEVNRRRAVA